MSAEWNDVERRKAKYRRVQRLNGEPLRVSGRDFDRALSKVRSFRERGMSQEQISRASGVPRSSLSAALRGGTASMSRRNWRGIRAMQFEEPDDRARVSGVGTARRLGALAVDGFPLKWIAEQSNYGTPWYYQKLLDGHRGGKVTAAGARKIRELYDRLEVADPVAEGIPLRSVRYCRTFAARRDYAPRHCWDSDTLDDPSAFPEWTGACGTARGRRIHAREGIPECQPCRERALDPAEGFQAATFRAMRLERGWSQPQLGDRIGVARESVAGWETGRTNPRETIVPAILEAFQVERGALFKET